jgi:1-acyl-sn-glycerol-3-phosphate acyltransferase
VSRSPDATENSYSWSPRAGAPVDGTAVSNSSVPGTGTKRSAGAARPALVRPSHRLLFLFRFYLYWYIGRHFHGMRVAHADRFPQTDGPLIVYANHASWWDPLSFLIISRYLLPQADHYAPMDAAALKHYGFLRKLGIFPVEGGTTRGAAQFLHAARAILSTPRSVLWLTPEGQFTDMRTRPAVFRPGMAAMVARLGACTLVPLAFEYTFWDERLPEILLSCGEPIHVTNGREHTTAAWSETLGAALAQTQDELAALVKLRDPARFSTVLHGRVGISGIYELWKRLISAMTRRSYHDSHGSIRGSNRGSNQ